MDAIPPVISACPAANIAASLSSGCSMPVSWIPPTATDNCGGVTIVSTHNSGDNFPKGTTPVVYTATDDYGNTATCSFNVVVSDPILPVISGCPSDVTVSANLSCQALVNWTAPTVSDNCGGMLSLTTTNNPGTLFNLGTTVVTYTLTDVAGNTSTCSFNVLVQDNTNPLISACPSNINVNANGSCQAIVNWTAPTASDNCGGTLTLTSTKNSGTAFDLGTTVVTYTATDAAGNISTCSFNVIVQDNTNPVIIGCPSNITVNANASCQAIVNWTAPTVSDNCGGTLTLNTTKNPGTVFNLGTTIVTYTAADAAGNTSTCSFNVTVTDNTNPVIAGCPSNITVSANASCQATVNWSLPTVSDNCGGTLSLTSTRNPGTIFNLGTTVVTYTASDAVGNISTCSFNVTVQDNTNPVISGCPSNITVNANGSCQAIVNWTPPTASDNCTVPISVTSTKNPGTVFSLGTTVVTYTATDAASNTSTCSFNVTVLDNTIPVITGCPSNITINANGSCQAIVNWTAPSATDNCGGTPALTSTKSPGTTFGLGTTVVTYTATDAAGNASTCSFNVIVEDNSNPVILGCPANITVIAGASCQATVNWAAPTVSDNCGGTLSLTSTKNPGTVFGMGTTPVTYTATDAAGNTATCTFNVLVEDKTKPIISGCPSNITVAASASCTAVVNWSVPTVSDNCLGPGLSSTKNPGALFALGTTVVIYTATDASGNVSTCSFNVIVEDNTDPVISACPSNIIVNADASCQAIVNWAVPTVSDNCGATLTPTKPPGAVFGLGTTVVTYTAIDAGGNTATCSFNVTVQDVTSPTFNNCPSTITVSANASCEAVVNWTAPTASDSCDGTVVVSSTNHPGSVFSLGSTTVTYTAIDLAGNVSTCSFAVIVQDHTAPQISGCSDVVVAVGGGACETRVSWPAPTSADCGSVAMTSSYHSGDVFNVGTTEVIYTATDNNGNTSTCSFNVIVEDKIAPLFNNCPADVVITVNDACEASVNWTEPIASDNCAVDNIIKSHAPGDIFTAGTTTVKYTAEDANGNQVVCEFDVTVKVVDIPVFTYCPENIQVKSNEYGQAVVDWAVPTATTACSAVPLTLTSSHQPGDIFPIGTTTVKYKAEDPFGNAGYCEFQVEVKQTDIDINVSPLVTPDGNAQNDEWIVTNIENFKDNKVVIVDRWGSVIYTASGYNNQTVVWDGSNRQGSVVPTGTYFYTISVRYGPAVFEKTGFIELIR
jgi:gliding motility-associated-like protein